MNFFIIGPLLILLSFAIAALVIKNAGEIELVDTPNERSSHTKVIPKSGGLVFSALFTGVALYLYLFNNEFKYFVTPCLIGGPALFGLGWLDDRYRLSAKLRLICQFLISAIVLFGLTKGFSHFSDYLFLPSWWWLSLLFSLLYLTWFVNLYNFMDGADGIAGGGGALASAGLAVIAYNQGSLTLATLYALLVCCLIGFVFFNWSPARFFMGDSGAYFLGITFAVLALAGNINGHLSLYASVIMFGLFIVDATFTLFTRIMQKQNPLAPHQQFGFHKLFKKGWTHGQAATLYLTIMGVWLFPLAFLSIEFPSWSFILLIVSYLPLVAFEVYIKAGKG